MEKDFIIENFTPPPHPKNIQLNGRTVRLEPLDALKHAEDLFQSNSFDREGMNWKYLPYGPFEKIEDYAAAFLNPDIRTTIANLESLLIDRGFTPKNAVQYAESIKQSIDSVLNQSFKDFELIIIDDGSSDNSKETIRLYEDNPKIKIIYQKFYLLFIIRMDLVRKTYV